MSQTKPNQCWRLLQQKDDKITQLQQQVRSLQQSLSKKKQKIVEYSKNKFISFQRVSKNQREANNVLKKPATVKKQVLRLIKNAVQLILDILNSFKWCDKNRVIDEIIDSNNEYDDHQFNKYLQRITNEHNKSVLNRDKNNKNALLRYYINICTGTTQQGYQSLHTNTKYENIWKNRVRKKSELGLFCSTSTSYGRGLKEFKKILHYQKQEKIDLMCGAFHFENENILKWQEYETIQEYKVINEDLVDQKIEHIHGEIRRSPVKYILRTTPEITLLDENNDEDELYCNITMDGCTVAGDSRGKSLVAMSFRIPDIRIFSHDTQNMGLLSIFWCKESHKVLKKVIYKYYTPLIQKLEGNYIQFTNCNTLFKFKSMYFNSNIT